MHGKVPDSVNKELVSKALEQKGLKKVVEYQSSMKREDMLKKAERTLLMLVLQTQQHARSSHTFSLEIYHVLAVHKGENKPQSTPDLPFYASEPISVDKKGYHLMAKPIY